MSKTWHYGNLAIHDSAALPPLVAGACLVLNHRERIVLSLLAAGEGREIPETALRQGLGRARTPIKVVISTLRARIAAAGVDIATIERGEDGYFLAPRPVVETDTSFEHKGGCLSFHADTGRLSLNGNEIGLSANGRRLFGLLHSRAPAFVSHAQLLAATHSGADTPKARRALASAIWNLRQKLRRIGAQDAIETCSKLGYRLREI